MTPGKPGPLERAARRSRDRAGVASPEGLGVQTIRVQPIGPRAGRRAQKRVRSAGTCLETGKLQFHSEEDALDQAVEWAKMNGFSATSRSAYRCKICKYWHLTSRGR